MNRLHDISLKWKLLIPFLSLAFVGATALFVVSYRFQADLIHLNEEKRLKNSYQYFLDLIKAKGDLALSLAYAVAQNPVVAETFAKRDRNRLIELLHPTYEQLHENFGIKQFHFHVPPATSFLRLHLPGQYGEEMQAYRHTINVARDTGEGVGGLEWGVTGFGVRGVVPVFFEGEQVGTLGLGESFEEPLLDEFKASYGVDLTLYVPEKPGSQKPMGIASTMSHAPFSRELFIKSFHSGEVVFDTTKWKGRDIAFVAGPVRDFSSKIAAVVEIHVDRGSTLALLKRYGSIAIAIGLIGLALSMSFVWFISVVFTKRIGKVVTATKDIAGGQRDTRITVKSADELGIMARAINDMLVSLEESRKKIKDYAENLEQMVEHRTKALEESEKTYRTLVEHVPVIVYLVMPDRTAIFLNRFVEEILGVEPQELSGHHEAWAEHIHSPDRTRVLAQFDECLQQGREFHAEYRMTHRDGHTVYVVDHAVPVLDEQNGLIRMDGVILDVTARKELQERIVQTEELETLSEVSARLAHEIGNPLTSIGGLTRRLLKSFEASDPRRKKGELIVEEVKKLERILKMMTAYIEPKSIQLRSCDLNSVVQRAIQQIEAEFHDKDFSVKSCLDKNPHMLKLDCQLFEKVLINLMENAFYRMRQKGEIEVTTGRNGGYATVILAYEVPYISDDDIEHFFYPFVIDYPFESGVRDRDIIDVPICSVVIHKHGGIINVNKKKDNCVVITISLPLEQSS
ncbi:MAG: cache domain-containing protein [Thermodesulfobacteriota bacterium]|nr:cache domain-containing protein [Thermodesulfobacteriota bacterium]